MTHQIKKHLGARILDDGVEFRVWAPFAASVSITGVINDWVEQPLESEKDGYWSLIIEQAEAGQSYRYIITTADGRKLEKNDPYARQVTESDNGMSIVTNPTFDWGDTESFVLPPKEQQIIYELHIGTFNRPDASTSGTFASAIEKLDYLKDLGVNVIELMPVTSMAMNSGWGYELNHIFSIEESYGGRHGLLQFIKAAHQHGIAVLLDVIYNHFSAKTDLWQFDGWSENERGGIYFYNDERGDTPWGGRPDYGRPEVRQFILDNITMWFNEYRIDGLRVDSTAYMRNIEGPYGTAEQAIGDAWSLLQEVTTLARKVNPNIILIAEDSSVESQITAPEKQSGLGFDSQWGLEFPHTLRASLGIHGEPSLNGLSTELLHIYNNDIYQKVIFSDSHDTAANGNVRLNEASSPGNASHVTARKRMLVANAIMLTAPGIPMLLQGEEFMQPGSFNDYHMLEWENTEQFAGIVLAHKHLIDLRLNKYRNTAGLMGHSASIFHQDNTNVVLGYHRWEKGGVCDDTLVIVNFSKHRLKDYALRLPLGGKWHVRFNSSWNGYSKDFYETKLETLETDEANEVTISLSDYNVIILSQD